MTTFINYSHEIINSPSEIFKSHFIIEVPYLFNIYPKSVSKKTYRFDYIDYTQYTSGDNASRSLVRSNLMKEYSYYGLKSSAYSLFIGLLSKNLVDTGTNIDVKKVGLYANIKEKNVKSNHVKYKLFYIKNDDQKKNMINFITILKKTIYNMIQRMVVLMMQKEQRLK